MFLKLLINSFTADEKYMLDTVIVSNVSPNSYDIYHEGN
jgi:hypothetical protein